MKRRIIGQLIAAQLVAHAILWGMTIVGYLWASFVKWQLQPIASGEHLRSWEVLVFLSGIAVWVLFRK